MTDLKWGIFAGCINEETLIEAKLEWALERGFAVSIVEGHHPHYKNVNESGLSIDKTTEILKSYADRINYQPLGKVAWQGILRDKAYKGLPEDCDVVIMSDIDEFILDPDIEMLDKIYKHRKDIVLTLLNSYIFLDNEYCAPHIQRDEGGVKFGLDLNINLGQYHERIFRYNKFYGYKRSPFLINDIFGRFILSNSCYFNDRMLFEDKYILHYKNFKIEEAKARHKMYKERGDKIDYGNEWKELDKNKFKYEGEHPSQIMKLLQTKK